MILRNLQLNERARRELNNNLFDLPIRNRKAPKSLLLSNISSCRQEDDEKNDCAEAETENRPSSLRTGGLNCDFLMLPKTDNVTIGEPRIEELTIERCRLDLEGALVLGRALENPDETTSYSSISSLRSLKMTHLCFTDEANDENDILYPILEGIHAAGKRRKCLESIEFRHITLPNSRTTRRRLFSAIGSCTNLKSLRLIDCDIRTEDAKELASALRDISNSLETIDLSRNQLDGTGMEILLRNGLCDMSNLNRLILSHNPIGNDGAIHLSHYLSRTSQAKLKLQSLWLVDCDIWSGGCLAMAKRLRDFDALRELVVCAEWENHLETVAESLESNVVLKHFFVVSNFGLRDSFDSQNQKHRDRIEYFLALNRSHRRISVERSISFQLWPNVLASKPSTQSTLDGRTCNADVWYHLLQRRPELVAPHVTLS